MGLPKTYRSLLRHPVDGFIRVPVGEFEVLFGYQNIISDIPHTSAYRMVAIAVRFDGQWYDVGDRSMLLNIRRSSG